MKFGGNMHAHNGTTHANFEGNKRYIDDVISSCASLPTVILENGEISISRCD